MIENKLIVVNMGDDSISIIDLQTYDVNNIYLKDFRNISLSLINYFKKNKLGPIDIIPGNEQEFLILNSYDESLIKINIKFKTIEKISKVGKNPICFNVYKEMIYVLNCDSNSLLIIDKRNNKKIEEIYLGEQPMDLQIDNTEDKLYIASTNNNSINIVNLINLELKTIKLNTLPIKLIINIENICILSYLNNGVINYSALSIGDKDGKNIRTHNLKGIFIDFVEINNKEFLLANPDDGYIYKYDFILGVLNKFIFIGGMPNKIACNKGKNIAYVIDLLNNILVIIDILRPAIMKKIRVGIDPQNMLLL